MRSNPIPQPKRNEGWQHYVSRLMRDTRMLREFPSPQQRMAVIANTWRSVYGARSHAAPKRNPPLVVIGNPGAHTLGYPLSIRYQHAEDGLFYEHKFGDDDVIELMQDGTLRIRNKH